MEKYEYFVATADGKSYRVIADSIKGVLAAVDEEKSPIINIFRNVAVSEGNVSKPATVRAVVSPIVAYNTGYRAFPTIPVETKQGKAVTLGICMEKGWKFLGWYTLDDKLVSTDPQATVIVADAGEVIYVARFDPAV